MNATRKNGAIGLILNGALVFIATFSMLSGLYPAWSTWIFFAACFTTLAALGVAAKVAWRSENSSDAEADTAENDCHTAEVDEGSIRANPYSDAAKALSSIGNAAHPDTYWKIIEQIALRRNETVTRRTTEDFSITLNIINVYTGAERRDIAGAPSEKIDFVLLPELEESLKRDHH